MLRGQSSSRHFNKHTSLTCHFSVTIPASESGAIRAGNVIILIIKEYPVRTLPLTERLHSVIKTIRVERVKRVRHINGCRVRAVITVNSDSVMSVINGNLVLNSVGFSTFAGSKVA